MSSINVKGMYQVLPYVYIGDADAACNKAELQRLGVTTILNCASEDVDDMFPEDFKYTDFPIEDVHTGMYSYISLALSFRNNSNDNLFLFELFDR